MTRVWGNHTLRTLVNRTLRVQITLVRVVITFGAVETTLRAEITLVRVIFTRIRVKLTIVCVETTQF
jgi:hypothetical protein